MKAIILLLSLFLLGCAQMTDTTTVVLETTKGTIELEIYTDVMPITGGNFVKLVNEGFYDGIIFHRVIPDFMIQGGDPDGRGTGGPGYAIQDEFVDDSRLTNVIGTISMANSGPNSGGSQFFINTADNTFLDFNKPPATSKHPVFGKVTTGLDVVEAISKVPSSGSDKPLEDVVITKAYVK